MPDPAELPRDRVLAENLRFLGVLPATRQSVEGVEPAELHELAHGSFLVRHGDAWLGAPGEDAQLGAASGDGPQPVVVFGLGCGDLVRQVRETSRSPVVVFEPDPRIARAVLEQGPSTLGDVDLVCSFHDLTQLWPGLAQGEAGAILVRTPGYREAFPEEHGELERRVAELVQRTGMNQNTHRQRARTWIADLIQNVGVLTQSVPFAALEGQLRGVPAFIVGAGPSLSKNGPLLGEAAKRGLVIAVNSSARALASYGVEPQVLCCIESIDVGELLGSLPFIDRVVRAFSLSGHPNTLRTGRGPLLPVWEAIPELSATLERLTGRVGLPVAGSVSTLAFSLAHRLGCSPIVLVGQDLAYTGNRAYAKGAAYEGSHIEVTEGGEIRIHWCDAVRAVRGRGAPPIHETEPLQPVAAWGGEGVVPSGPGFSAVRAWLEAAAEVLQRADSGVELVNATEGGSHVAGFDEVRLEELLRRLPLHAVSAEELTRRASELAKPQTSSEVRAWAEGERRAVREVRTAADAARRAAEQALQAVRGDRSRRVGPAFARLERCEESLRRAVAAAPMVDAWAFTPVDEAVSDGAEAGRDSRASAELGLRREIAVARAISQSARELDEALGVFATHARTAHESGEPTPCPL